MRRLLVLTLGSTPQIVTETVYGLVKTQDWTPTDVVLCTTCEGRDLFENGDAGRGLPPLLGPDQKWERLLSALEVPPDDINLTLVVPKLSNGEEILDIRSPDEIAAFADTFIDVLRNATNDPDTVLHVSLAGGRKTMSYVAGVAMSLVARPQDTLSHVLVSPAALETDANFWWPGQTDPAHGVSRSGYAWSAADASINLHSVPFVHLRAFDVPSQKLNFSQTVNRASTALRDDAILVIDLAKKEIRVGEIVYRPTSLILAIYLLAALSRREDWAACKNAGLTYDVIANGRDNSGARIFKERFRECLEQTYKTDDSPAALADAASKALGKIEDRRGDATDVKTWMYFSVSRSKRDIAAAFPAALHGKIILRDDVALPWPGEHIEIVG